MRHSGCIRRGPLYLNTRGLLYLLPASGESLFFRAGGMLKDRFVTPIFLAGLLVLDAGLASGQGYPNKPIRVIASGAGGGQDFVARLIAPGIAAALGQPVIVENRAGGFVSAG